MSTHLLLYFVKLKNRRTRYLQKKIYSPDLIVAFICQIEEALSDILSLLTGVIKCERAYFLLHHLGNEGNANKRNLRAEDHFLFWFLKPSVCLTVWNT